MGKMTIEEAKVTLAGTLTGCRELYGSVYDKGDPNRWRCGDAWPDSKVVDKRMKSTLWPNRLCIYCKSKARRCRKIIENYEKLKEM